MNIIIVRLIIIFLILISSIISFVFKIKRAKTEEEFAYIVRFFILVIMMLFLLVIMPLLFFILNMIERGVYIGLVFVYIVAFFYINFHINKRLS